MAHTYCWYVLQVLLKCQLATEFSTHYAPLRILHDFVSIDMTNLILDAGDVYSLCTYVHLDNNSTIGDHIYVEHWKYIFQGLVIRFISISGREGIRKSDWPSPVINTVKMDPKSPKRQDQLQWSFRFTSVRHVRLGLCRLSPGNFCLNFSVNDMIVMSLQCLVWNNQPAFPLGWGCGFYAVRVPHHCRFAILTQLQIGFHKHNCADEEEGLNQGLPCSISEASDYSSNSVKKACLILVKASTMAILANLMKTPLKCMQSPKSGPRSRGA